MYILFCPNPRCHYHRHKSKRTEQLFASRGSYRTRAHGVVPRCLCLCCRSTAGRAEGASGGCCLQPLVQSLRSVLQAELYRVVLDRCRRQAVPGSRVA